MPIQGCGCDKVQATVAAGGAYTVADGGTQATVPLQWCFPNR